jgi:hypothetical protein
VAHHAVHGARTGLVDLENGTDEELALLKKQFEQLKRQGRVNLAALAEEEGAELGGAAERQTGAHPPRGARAGHTPSL